MQQRRKQPVQTKQALLDAVGELLGRHGYAGTSLGAVVELAGLTKGALFHHFADKQALVVGWVEDGLGPAMRAAWVEPLGVVDSLDGLRAFCRRRCLEFQAGDATAALVALTAETMESIPALGAAMEPLWDEWRTAVEALFERGRAAGWVYRSIQPAVEAALLVAMFAGISASGQGQAGEATRRACATGMEGYLETLRVA